MRASTGTCNARSRERLVAVLKDSGIERELVAVAVAKLGAEALSTETLEELVKLEALSRIFGKWRES